MWHVCSVESGVDWVSDSRVHVRLACKHDFHLLAEKVMLFL